MSPSERKTSAKRKLVPYTLLSHLAYLNGTGVPVARLIRDYKLSICSPTLVKLIFYCGKAETDPVIFNSLFPSWLTPKAEVQENPDGHYYVGRFPTGVWRA